MNWYLKVLKQYTDFNGRARRKEYWMFPLFNMIIMIVFQIPIFWFKYVMPEIEGGQLFVQLLVQLSGLYILAMLIPGLAVAVRRLHDVGKSGWMILITFIPFIGGIWLLVLMVTDSNPGENQYGANPKEVTV